jgi:hypothetical protein
VKRTQTATSFSTRKRTLLLIAAAALILAVLVARHCAGLNVPSVDPTVSLERTQSDDSPNLRTNPGSLSLPDDNEVYRTAERLREASALALAAALKAANEQSNGRLVHSVDALIAGIRSAGLLPPGVATDGSTVLLSDRSSLVLRFRPDPLAIEVLSFPRSRQDGPALMIRIPALGNDGDRGSVFIADRLGDINPPMPFATLSDCVRAGWIDQPFNQSEIAEAEQQQLRNWLATRRPH